MKFVMKWKGCGSYTVEGTVIVCLICLIVGSVIMLGFYGHDRALMQSTADELALYGGFWEGRYAHPKIREVDYELMKRNGTISHETIEEEGYRMLAGRLFCGKLQKLMCPRVFQDKNFKSKFSRIFRLENTAFRVRSGLRRRHRSQDLPRQNKRIQEDETNES
ncbi:MAG: hypothetical protein V8R85_10365 [Frisingicoccus sp.]